MDSWPLEEEMGVVKQAALRGLIQAIRKPPLVRTGLRLCWIGHVQLLTIVCAMSQPSLTLVIST